MGALLGAAAKVSTGWSLAAFGIAALLFLLGRGRNPKLAVIGAIAIVVLGALPILADYLARKDSAAQVYRIRAIVLSPAGDPVDEAEVWSSVGGEAKAVRGGWEFAIPAASRPAHGRMTVYARQASAFLRGQAGLALASDLNPAVTVQLRRAGGASVRGLLADTRGRAVAGAEVSVVGYPDETTTTDARGNFALGTQAADGQQVALHVEAKGATLDQYVMAGDSGVRLMLPER